MTDDRRSQPIDIRIPDGGTQATFRELLLEVGAQIGALRATVDHAHEDSRQLGDKLDILGDKVDELNAAVQRGIGDGRLQDKVINDLVVIIDGNGHKPGLLSRLDKVEKTQERNRNVAIGVGIGSALGGGAFGASVVAALRKFGVLIICAMVLLGAAAWAAAHAFPPPGADLTSPTAQWFQGLKVPDDPRNGATVGLSCCSIADCRPVDYRQDAQGYEVLIGKQFTGVEDPFWKRVPAEVVLRRKENPLGQPVVCYYNKEIRCFVAPDET